MNTNKATASDVKKLTRRDFVRILGAAALAIETIVSGCASSQQTIRLPGGRELTLPNRHLDSDYSIEDMRDIVSALNEILGRIVETARNMGQYHELNFNQSSASGMARTAEELAEDFMHQSSTADATAQRLANRFEFVYSQLVYLIRYYRDHLAEEGISTQNIPALLGYSLNLRNL